MIGACLSSKEAEWYCVLSAEVQVIWEDVLWVEDFRLVRKEPVSIEWSWQKEWNVQEGVVLGLYTVKNVTILYCYNSDVYEAIFIIYGRTVTEKASSQEMPYFPPHLTSASELPGERQNPEIAVFHLNTAGFFSSNTQTH